MKKLTATTCAVAAALTAAACGDVEDPTPTKGLATLISSTQSETTSTPPVPTQNETPAAELDQPTADEQHAQLYSPAPKEPPQTGYYPSCDAARAAGAAPLHAGDPGYRRGLDRDGDGIACE